MLFRSAALQPGRYAITGAVEAAVGSAPSPSASVSTAVGGIPIAFFLDAVPTYGQVSVEVAATEDGRPLTAELTLAVVVPGAEIQVESVTGATLRRNVAPGTYVAAFTLPGGATGRRLVTVAASDRATVRFASTGGQTVEAGITAVPGASGSTTAAQLRVTIRNPLFEVPGPVEVSAAVTRDGRPVETVAIATLPSLPMKDTEVRATYDPPGGLGPGRWAFHIVVSGRGMTVVSDPDPSLAITGSGLFGAVGTLGLPPLLPLVAAILGWIILREPLTAPRAAGVEQSVWDEFLFNDPRQREGPLSFAPATLDKAKAQLTVRDRNEDAPSVIQASAWEYAGDRAVRLLPAGTPFRAGAL